MFENIYVTKFTSIYFIIILNQILLFISYRSYHLTPTTKGVYPVQLTDADYVDFHRQNFMQNGMFRNHFFDYEDKHAKHRSRRDDISRGLAPLRCVRGTRTLHKIDESMIDPAKRQGLGPRISYKVTAILHEHLFHKIYNLKQKNMYTHILITFCCRIVLL